MKNPWNSIKQKIDSSVTPMQEGDWAAMESMLGKPKSIWSWSKFGKYGLSILLGAAIGVGAYAAWNFTHPEASMYTPLSATQLEKTSQSAVADGSDIPHEEDALSVSSEVSSTHETQSLDENPSNKSSLDMASNVNESTPSTSNQLGPRRSQTENSTVPRDETENPETIPSDESHSDGLIAGDELNPSQPNVEPGHSEEQDASTRSNPSEDAENETPQEGEPASGKSEEEETEEEMEDLPKEEASSTSEEDSPVIRRSDDPSSGFAIEANYHWNRSINSGLQFHETGLDLAYTWNQWNFQTGVHYVSTFGRASQSIIESQIVFDSNFVETYQTRNVVTITQTWVITGRQTGMYVYDTTITQSTDTVLTLSIDSSEQNIARLKTVDVAVNYFSVPLLVGYEWKMDKLSFGLQSGVNFRSISYGSLEVENATKYGLDFTIRPFLGYQFLPKWSAYVRPTFNIPLTSDPIFNRQNFVNAGVQVGMRYSF